VARNYDLGRELSGKHKETLIEAFEVVKTITYTFQDIPTLT
jgi:hypothetical protein